MKIEDNVAGTIRDSHIVQIFIFRGEDYLGWDCFNKDSIAVGRSSTADLILDDESMAAFQAIVFCNNGHIHVELLETRSSRKITVRPGQFDSIQIGPYTLKIKLKGVHGGIDNKKQSFPEATVKKIADQDKPNRDKPYQDKPDRDKTDSPVQVKAQGKKSCPPQPETKINEVPQSADVETSESIRETGETAPIKEETVEHVEKSITSDTEEHESENGSTENTREHTQPIEKDDNNTSTSLFDWDDEEDEEDFEAPFSLRERVVQQSDSVSSNINEYSGEMLLEIIKSTYDKVCDVSFLSSNQKYIIENNGRFCLAENKKGTGRYVYFQGHHTGTIHPDKSTQHALETLRTPEHMFHKRKRIYRYQLPKSGIALIHDGPCEYRIKSVRPGESPAVQETVKNDNAFFKHFVKSSVLHLFFLLFVGLFPGFKLPENLIESH